MYEKQSVNLTQSIPPNNGFFKVVRFCLNVNLQKPLKFAVLSNNVECDVKKVFFLQISNPNVSFSYEKQVQPATTETYYYLRNNLRKVL